jgi:hypothetical protein
MEGDIMSRETYDALREPEVLKKLGEWHAQELSNEGMIRNLRTQFQIEATAAQIKSAYEVYAVRSAEIIAGDAELKGALKETVVRAADTINMINERVSGILLRSPDEANILGAAGQLMKLLELQYKLLNHFKEGFNIDKVNRIEYTKVSINNLDELSKAGYIKILRRPGQVFDPTTNEVIELTEAEMNKFIREKIIYVLGFTIKVKSTPIEPKVVEADIVEDSDVQPDDEIENEYDEENLED